MSVFLLRPINPQPKTRRFIIVAISSGLVRSFKMLGGLYGDLPPPSSAEENKPTTNVWSNSTKMAPATLRKPSSIFTPPHTLLKSQNKPKISNSKPSLSTTPTILAPAVDEVVQVVQPVLVGMQSTVLEEYDQQGLMIMKSIIGRRRRI
ncbi:hypothetical protein RYX36_036699 [Vicia faba]